MFMVGFHIECTEWIGEGFHSLNARRDRLLLHACEGGGITTATHSINYLFRAVKP
jgi:hypothetical protein